MEKAWLFESTTNLSCCSWLETSEREPDRGFLQEASRGASLVLSIRSVAWQPHGLEHTSLLCPCDFPGIQYSREYSSGFSFPFTGDLSHPRTELSSPALLVDPLSSEPAGKPWNRPANTGDPGSIPSPGRPHMPRSNSARGPQLRSLCSRAGNRDG